MGSKAKQAIFLANQREARAEQQAPHTSSPEISHARRHEKRGHKQRAWSERGHGTPEEGFTEWVAMHLTSRNQKWLHTVADGRKVYEANWRDISVYEPERVQQKISEVLAQVGIYGAELEPLPEQGIAMRIRIPEAQFNAQALSQLGNQRVRIHEQTGRGGR